MKQVLNPNIEAGLKESNEPRLLGSIVSEMLHGNSPLAIGYRQYIASKENAEAEAETGQLFRDFYPNTELGIDLKLITRKPGRMRVNDSINCTLTHDDENHYTAVENALKRSVAEPRNAHIYVGDCVNVNVRTDGIVYPTFRYGQLYSGKISFKDFCLAAAQELLTIARLGEESSEGVAS